MRTIMIAVAGLALLAVSCSAQELVAGKDGSIRNVDTRAMITDSGETYLATRSEVYRAVGDKGKWESVFALPQGESGIACLGGDARTVFAGTGRGLYRTRDFGKTWAKVFRTIIPEKSNVLCVEASRSKPGQVLIGTEKGVFLSADSGERWQDVSANLKNRRVKCVTTINDLMYACAEDGLYMHADGIDGWERLVIRSAVLAGEESASADDADGAMIGDEEPEAGRAINCIANKEKRLYLGLDKTVLYSDDEGRTWQDFPSQGLNGIITYIRTSARTDMVYCATMKGVFIFDPARQDNATPRWQEVYKGTDKVFNANALVYGDENEKFIWALTDQGLYRLEWAPAVPDQPVDVERNMQTFKIIHDTEPAFKELQRAAMKYAEVEPEKIKEWRSQARLKALVPKLSVGLDHDTSTNTEMYTSATQRYILEGPLDKGDGWDVSLSWELSDLIWSTDQTSIDVRSRLTTQLRIDILDDLRRAYFERKRLQYECVTNPPRDARLVYEKELRIQELTQAIDDLTGNYLTDHTRKDGGNDQITHTK